MPINEADRAVKILRTILKLETASRTDQLTAAALLFLQMCAEYGVKDSHALLESVWCRIKDYTPQN